MAGGHRQRPNASREDFTLPGCQHGGFSYVCRLIDLKEGRIGPPGNLAVRSRYHSMQRIFIVGHPRSGTTIVQAMMGRHPDVYTLPETFFFQKLYRDHRQRLEDPGCGPVSRDWKRRLQLTPKSARNHLERMAREIACPLTPLQPRLTLRQATRTFAAAIDQAAQAAQCRSWAEKTPLHLLYLPEISRDIDGALFVHVLRQGEQVIASTLDAHLRYPGLPFSSPLGYLIKQWNRTAEIHARYMGQPRHHFVFHDRLTANPAGEWERLRHFLSLDPRAGLAASSHHAVASLEQEPWKQSALDGKVRDTVDKVAQLFGPKLQQLLQQRLIPYAKLTALHDAKISGIPA